MTTNSVIIYSSDTYVIFNKDGEYRVIQGDDCLASTYTKAGVVRKRKLPNWCLKALKEGYWIEVSEFVPSGTDRDTFYLTVRGKTVRPKTKVETETRTEDRYSDDVWHRRLVKVDYQRERLEYNGFQKPISFYEGWKKVNETFLKGITKEDYEKFKKNNPLPAREEKYYEDYVHDKSKYTFKDSYAIRTDYTVVHPHTEGWWYSYQIDSDYKPFIEKNKMNDCWEYRWIEDDKTVLAIIKKELVKSYDTYEDSAKYESDDGMRMTSDRYYFTVYVYDVVLSDGSCHQFTERKYH